MELRQMKKWLCGVGAAALVLCCLPAAHAANEPARVVRVGYFRTGMYVEQAPDGSVSGYGPEYLEQVAQHTGWKFEYECGAWPELLEKLRRREIDLIGAVQRGGPEAGELEFCRYACANESFYLYGRRDAEERYYNDYPAFDGMTVALVEGSRQDTVLDEMERAHGFSTRRVTAPDEAEAARLVQSGRADAMVTSTAQWQNAFKLLSHITVRPVYPVSWKGNTELIDRLETALGEIMARDPAFVQDLQLRHFGGELAERQPAFTREQSEFIAQAGPVRVLVYSRPPWSWVDAETGQVKGITADILKELAAISGLELAVEALPGAVSPVQGVKNGDYDLGAGLMDEALFREDGEVLLGRPYYSDTLIALCRQGFSGLLTDELRVETPAGFAAGRHYLKEHHPQYQLGDSDTIQECLAEVLAGRADIAIEDTLVFGQLTQNPRYESLASLPRFFIPEDLCLMARNEEKGKMLISILNESIRCLDEDVLSRIVLNNTVASPSQLTWRDVLYKYRSALLVGGVLAIVLVGVLACALAQRHRHVAALRATNARLEQAVRQTQQATRAKGDFLSRMSHEIRTPLNAILGFSSLAEQHLGEREKARDYLQKTQTAGRLLLGIINDVLDMSAIERGKLKLAAEPFDLCAMLEGVDSMYSAQCREKGIRYVVDRTPPPEHCVVVGDELRTQQVLLNLLSNAVKFTPAGGRVELKARRVGEQKDPLRLRFEVSDTGEGMSSEMLRHVFQPFEQEDGTTARRHGGSGLGLSIVKGLVDAMGGTLEVQSEKGRGTRFTVELPFTLSPGSRQLQAAARGPAQPPRLEGTHILLAEDNEMNALLAQELLRPTGAQVDWVADGKKALQTFLASPEHHYQMILMDIQMPGMNGYETTRQLRAAPRADAPGVPILAMTADAFKEDVEKAAAAGMDGHVAKPIDPGALYRALAGHML